MKRAGAVALLAVVLTACGGEESGSDEPSAPTEESSSSTAAPTETEACEMVAGGSPSVIERIPVTLTSIGAETTDEQVDDMLDIQATINDAAEVEDVELSAALTSLNVPFAQFASVVEQGGGDLNMNTANVGIDVARIMQLCGDVGYSVDP